MNAMQIDDVKNKETVFIAHGLSYNIPQFGRKQSTHKIDSAHR